MSTSPAPAVPDPSAPQAVPQRIVAAWADNDADAFAAVFTKDASLILPGVHLTGQDQIRDHLAAGFAGPYRGTRVVGEPLSLTRLGDDVTVIVTQGGVLAPGEAQVAAARAIRATWVLHRQDHGWSIAAYQNTPVHTN